MGRAKLNMELISKEKSRNTTFKKRREGLYRKLHEFTTLCDVRACMIIYGPKQENGAVKPDIWPQDPDEIMDMINTYKSKKKESGNKSFGLNDFFHDRKRKIEDELTKLRKRNVEVKYPTPPDRFVQHMDEAGLRAFASFLANKAELVRSRIADIKKSSTSNQEEKGQFYPHPAPLNDMHAPFPIYPTVNRNSMTMLLMNGEDQFGVGGASSSNVRANIQCASFKQEIYYAPQLPVPRYYAPPLSLPPLPPYMVAPPPLQLPFATGWENQDGAIEDVVKYEMKKY